MNEHKTISWVTFLATDSRNDIYNSIVCLSQAVIAGEDEIVIVIDDEHYNHQVDDILENSLVKGKNVKILHHSLNGDFAVHRNFAIDNCSKDYIFMLDADETINWQLLLQLHFVDSSVRVLAFPRLNQVIGFTDEDYKKANFSIDRFGNINYPDWQLRFFKNDGIRYTGTVHEGLTEQPTAYSTAHIIHIKTAEKQLNQLKFYNTEFRK